MNLDTAGAQLEVTEREDGVIELRPVVAVPADQAWFWTPEWQAGERQVDENYAAGRFEQHENVEEFVAALEEIMNENE